MKSKILFLLIVTVLSAALACKSKTEIKVKTDEMPSPRNQTAKDTTKEQETKAADLNVSRIEYNLGESLITLVIYSNGKGPCTLLNLHENETASINSAIDFVTHNGGRFIHLSQKGARNITFRSNGKTYSADPNRIFTPEGIETTLRNLSSFSQDAKIILTDFAEYIIKEISKDSNLIIAVHNNSNGSYSALSYQKENKSDAEKVFILPSEDPDNFFFVVREEEYLLTSSNNFNTILQNNKNVLDDGSLSVYCGKNNIPYVNVETEMGNKPKQDRMLRIFSTGIK